ncbi:alpha/beta fold hydrolase [Actinokineospora auranticolor]|uniref:Alpha/beta hydrolase family protein n=1 Tax=Actinokineospora auranticolor TaxID=155976 RepID=A0A2S6GWL9_9PSEU|nr:alpha/beta fold hydrolase [Actinokineospora auranticolor]PPK69597.1 alpha/beta hydrolase family protein [Actinokineospora auranticolor]
MIARVLAVLLLTLLCAVPAQAQKLPSQCEGARSTKAGAGQSRSKRPVVFVHGWNGDPMDDSAKKVAGQLDGRVSAYTFDYSRWAAYWASDSHIAPCLAAYLGQVSSAYEKAGGDGKVVVVAHSMGGLALRYALNTELAKVVPYVITLGTPQLGSPWGGEGGPSRLMEVLRHVTGKELPPIDGRDGGKCLAEHEKGASLPRGCGDLPPWLASGVNLTQVAGDVTVNRTFFGFTAYSIPLFSDGVVPVPSAHGYPTSGPTGVPPEEGGKSYSRTDRCTVDFGLVNGAAHSLSFASASMAFDYFTLQDLQENRFSAPVQAYLGGVTIVAACSHLRLPTDQSAVNQVTEIVQGALTELGKSTGAATKVVNVAGVDKSGNSTSGYTVAEDPEEVEDCYPSPAAVGPDVVACSPSAAGALACWVEPNRRDLLCGGFPWKKQLRRAVSKEAVPSVTPSPNPAPWGLELDGGAKCLLRNGGSWGGRADGYVGAYSCDQGNSDFVLTGPDGGDVVDRSKPVWTVQIGQLGGDGESFPPPTTKEVKVAYFAAAP